MREVLSSWEHLKNLVELQKTGNEKLKRKLQELSKALDDDDYEIIFELICTTELTEKAKEEYKNFQELMVRNDELPASISMIDNEELRIKYESTFGKELIINHKINLEIGKYFSFEVSGTNIVIATLQLKNCLDFPGIKDGTLFRKNVKQSLGLSNKVNKGIKSTIYSDKHRDFFFFHNGITAICNKMEMTGTVLSLSGLSVVNGCQSLNTILACSEKVKELHDTYIMFRFYEIPQGDRADRISILTNFQTSIKPRDLRSNDKRVQKMKCAFEQKYPRGYFITKRGENAPADRDNEYIIDIVRLGKFLISWHSQRPNIAYSETKIFDKYFEQLFKKEYDPENMYALNSWMERIMVGWVPENPFGLNESLLAMKAYAPYHQLYAISQCFSIASKQNNRVPNPAATYHKVNDKNIIDRIVNIAATSLDFALQNAVNEPQPPNRIFSPQNWIKTKSCLGSINAAINMQLMMLTKLPGGKELIDALIIPADQFEYRWAAD